MEVDDLFTDLADGKKLLKLLEIISGEKLGKPNNGKMRVHKVENVNKSLAFLHTKVLFNAVQPSINRTSNSSGANILSTPCNCKKIVIKALRKGRFAEVTSGCASMKLQAGAPAVRALRVGEVTSGCASSKSASLRALRVSEVTSGCASSKGASREVTSG
ncbi:hypothetical protein L9F63_002278, partial [Diploptera punctata]